MPVATPSLAGIEMEEFEYLESLANSKRFEFTNGVVTAKRGPCMTQKKHWIVADEWTAAFRDYRRAAGGLGGQTPTTNFSAGADRFYRIPDLAYWAAGRRIGDGIAVPPTAAVEIVSPDQSVADLRLTCRFYRDSGVEVCWLVEPEARWVEVWDATRDGVRLRADAAIESAALPGFRLELRTLWDAIHAAPA